MSYFIMWAIAGAILGAIYDNDNLLTGALKGLAIAILPIYLLFFFLLVIVLYPLFSLFGHQKEYDALINRISIFSK